MLIIIEKKFEKKIEVSKCLLILLVHFQLLRIKVISVPFLTFKKVYRGSSQIILTRNFIFKRIVLDGQSGADASLLMGTIKFVCTFIVKSRFMNRQNAGRRTDALRGCCLLPKKEFKGACIEDVTN